MKKLIYSSLLIVPTFAFAQSLGNLTSLVSNLKGLINSIIPLLLAVAVVYFFWGLITFIRAAGDPKAAESGKSIMIWGIVALFVMVSLWGILNWLTTTTNLQNTPINPPQIP
jgi:hypothetical protein